MAKKAKRWTANEIYELLGGRFPSPAFVLLPQVRNGTGFARAKDRTADAVAISVYPSRGLYATGIEIKVSRSDWRKELADPSKADEIQKFCRYWYVAAPKGVVPVGEVPKSWGLIECESRRTIETKTAPKLEHEKSPDWLFVASVLRSAATGMITRQEHTKAVSEARDHATESIRKAALLESVEYERDKLRDAIDEFQKASGVELQTWNGERIGNAVKAVMNGGHKSVIQEATRLRDASRRYSDLLTEILKLEQKDKPCQP